MADKDTSQTVQDETAEAIEQVTAQAETDNDADTGQLSQIQQDLEAAQAALADAEDQVLRAKADAQNVRRRAEQDVEKAHKFALEKFVNELLPVVDSLERAIDSCEGSDADAIREGVEMTLNMLMGTLKKFAVETVDPAGEPFDPQHHQAMSMVENAEVEPNTVLAVMQKGYLLNGRLVRPAMVVVSKAAPGDAVKIDAKA